MKLAKLGFINKISKLKNIYAENSFWSKNYSSPKTQKNTKR